MKAYESGDHMVKNIVLDEGAVCALLEYWQGITLEFVSSVE
jgi:hypothetical protein